MYTVLRGVSPRRVKLRGKRPKPRCYPTTNFGTLPTRCPKIQAGRRDGHLQHCRKASLRLVAMGLAAGLPAPPRGARDFKVLSIGILLLCSLPRACPGCVIAPDANGHVDYPAGETAMGDSAFASCTSLVSITLPSSLTSIGRYAFSHCTSLVSITLPSSLTSIGSNAFIRCTSLVNISLPAGLTSISSSAFYGCLRL